MINTGSGELGGTTSGKMQSLLDAIPDFTFLSEATVSMGQLFVWLINGCKNQNIISIYN